MIYCFDIDGTICTNTYGEYDKAQPLKKRIIYVNNLYDQGNFIKLFTARGSTSGINWEGKTILQLKHWGVKYHSLQLGKPEADIFVDDKAQSDKEFFNFIDE